MTLSYPTPEENPACGCKDNPMLAFFCSTGHMLECHYPYDCSTAACSHLNKYDIPTEQIKDLTAEARSAIESGERKPYQVDEHGNVWIDEGPTGTCSLGFDLRS